MSTDRYEEISTDRYQAGLAVRREVLGAKHVEQSLDSASEFTQPLQELVTEFCWGGVWSREDLDRRTRSLLNLAMLTALNRPKELELHVRGALTNGCTKAQILETLLQATIYCGVPAGIDAFRTAESVLHDHDSDGG